MSIVQKHKRTLLDAMFKLWEWNNLKLQSNININNEKKFINGFQNTSIVSEWLFWSCIEEAWTLEILKDVIPLFMSAEWWYTPSPLEESKPNSADIWYYNVLQLRYRKLHPACYQSNHM